MGKPKKQHRKKKYNYNKDRRRMWKKSKKLPKFACKEVLNAYDDSKSHSRNMEEMGLCMNPSETIGRLGSTPVQETPTKARKTPKAYVVQALEAQAMAPQARRVHMSEPEVRYCTYMMKKYGEDFEAMARDPRNYYQDTAKQIQKKINTFKSIPEQYQPYLQRQGARSART